MSTVSPHAHKNTARKQRHTEAVTLGASIFHFVHGVEYSIQRIKSQVFCWGCKVMGVGTRVFGLHYIFSGLGFCSVRSWC